jgi:hypothetical protein
MEIGDAGRPVAFAVSGRYKHECLCISGLRQFGKLEGGSAFA